MREKIFSEYEWLQTNSLGGYALGSSTLVNRRKYHGLLISSDESFKRTHMVSSIEETAEAGGARLHMDSTNYTGIVHPDGFKNITGYFPRPYPCFVYSGGPSAAGFKAVKTIKMHPRRNLLSVEYRNIGLSGFRLTLRPKFSMRDHHCLNPPGWWDSAPCDSEISEAAGKFEANGLACFVAWEGGDIAPEFLIYRNVSYIMEILRGYESTEDLAAPFRFDFELAPGEEACLLFSDSEADIACGGREIEERYSSVLLPRGHPYGPGARGGQGSKNSARAGYLGTLESAFLDFIANDDLVAGFPWFSAWGRDTMISLEALDYIRGHDELRKKILLNYARSMKNGVIPNTIGEGGEGWNYDTADASLWFGLRVMEFLDRLQGSDREELCASAGEVIRCYSSGTGLPFYTDPEDGLVSLHSGTELGLTWMDAKVHGIPVTPRYGKPVEINCLWHNLLKFYAGIPECGAMGPMVNELLRKTSSSLKKFFDGGTFCDRISGNGEPVKEIRPNYIIGLSLPFSAFSREETAAGYVAAKQHLLTPCGLRSLAPESPAFRGRYMGNQPMRDLAYHQGTVWVWLLLPMAKTAAKIYQKENLVKELEKMVYFFRKKCMDGELSSVPEIYDGEDPRSPKGAPAQCWSAAALLVIENMLKHAGG